MWRLTVLNLCFLSISHTIAFSLRRPTISRDMSLFSESRENWSIGDVVQGLHGSKYQFSDAGVNFEGQQFAEMSYSCGKIQEDDYEKEPIPNWALKRKSNIPSENCPQLAIGPEGTGTVEIVNDERSWEKFYGFILGNDPSSYSIEPRAGMLAPRGGANNFSDSATVVVKRNQNPQGDTWLLLCTEAESWTYKLL